MNMYFDKDWSGGNKCKLVGWMTQYSSMARDDYKRCVCDKFGTGEADCPKGPNDTSNRDEGEDDPIEPEDVDPEEEDEDEPEEEEKKDEDDPEEEEKKDDDPEE